jgi:hypothetical protein
MPASFNRSVQRRVTELLSGEPTPQKMNQALRNLAKWRAEILEEALVRRSGDRVLSGPFKGMAYPLRTTEGARNPRLVGCYEASLQPVIEEIIAVGYDLVIDIGAAEGYYAVGLALRMPWARVMARDAEVRAQLACRELARINRVEARLEVGGELDRAELSRVIAGRCVIICDTEGAEEELLDPQVTPALQKADILVEVHEGMKAGRVELLTGRFAESHDIRRIERRIDDAGLPMWADGLSDLDRLLLLWEWRSTPTPWLWMRRRQET